MLYGCCVNMLPNAEKMAGVGYASALAELGYDYIELPTRLITQLSETEFESACRILSETGLACRCCNDFMPAHYQIVGEDLTPERELQNYLSAAFHRLGHLKVPYTVFGSPWSRSSPQGFDRRRAWEQICIFLQKVGQIAADYGIVVTIEHNNHTETNMLNRFSDTAAMAREVDHPNIRLMCDYFHLRMEGEDPRGLLPFGNWLVHTHIARLEGRQYFHSLEGEETPLSQYAEVLKEIGYQGGVSIEARVPNEALWRDQAQETLKQLHRALD